MNISFRETLLSEKGASRSIFSTFKKPAQVLPALAILGANASGKSNVLKAISSMRQIVVESFGTKNPVGEIDRVAFAGSHKDESTAFEIEMIIDGIWHRYGFEVDDERVLQEYAYFAPRGRRVLMFKRERQEVTVGTNSKAKWRIARSLMRENTLLLSAGARVADHSDALLLFRWFLDNLWLADDESLSRRRVYTSRMTNDIGREEAIRELLQAADLGLTNIKLKETSNLDFQPEPGNETVASPDSLKNDDQPSELIYVHNFNGEDIEFDESQESKGTLAWTALIGPIFDILIDGGILLIDELGDSLHPILVQQIIKLFQQRETNPNFGQIIFNTHSVSVMGDVDGTRLLGRDQIYLAEKDYSGRSKLFRLSDLAPRAEEPIPKRYMEGSYGGMPIVDFNRYLATLEDQDTEDLEEMKNE